jgi:hypothetical protein
VGELIRETAALAESGQDEVAVRPRVEGTLPLVRADRERLRQVIQNLIDNAVKYSPAGAAVDVEAFAENGRITVEVRDRGPGIEPEHQSLIFESTPSPGRVSGSSSRGRSPRHTEARSRCARFPPRARRSRSSCQLNDQRRKSGLPTTASCSCRCVLRVRGPARLAGRPTTCGLLRRSGGRSQSCPARADRPVSQVS